VNLRSAEQTFPNRLLPFQLPRNTVLWLVPNYQLSDYLQAHEERKLGQLPPSPCSEKQSGNVFRKVARKKTSSWAGRYFPVIFSRQDHGSIPPARRGSIQLFSETNIIKSNQIKFICKPTETMQQCINTIYN